MKDFDLIFHLPEICASHFADVGEGGFFEQKRWVSTDFVDISPFFALRYELAANKKMISLAFYDKDKKYLSGEGTTSSCAFTTVVGSTLCPKGAYYARFITFCGEGNYDAMQTPFVCGFETKEEYESYIEEYPYHSLVVACIGDSLTEGDIGSYIPGTGVLRYRNYPYHLSRLLGCKTLNYGKCGYTAEGILSFYRAGYIDISQADIVLVMIGTNYGLTVQGDHQKKAYLALLEELEKDKKNNARIVLITSPHVTATKPEVAWFAKNAADEALTIAEEKQYLVIDAHYRSPIQADKENIYQPDDGLHMVEGGYQVFAEFIAKELRKLLENA